MSEVGKRLVESARQAAEMAKDEAKLFRHQHLFAVSLAASASKEDLREACDMAEEEFRRVVAERDAALARAEKAEKLAGQLKYGLHEATFKLTQAEGRAARLREALEKIAGQKRTDELETPYDVEYADSEQGYDDSINIARAALNKEGEG